MKKILCGGVLMLVLVVLVLVGACAGKESTVSVPTSTSNAVTSTKITTPTVVTTSISNKQTTIPNSTTQTNWWDKFGQPQYGGTITVPALSLSDVSFDPFISKGGAEAQYGYQFPNESLFWLDWTIDRSKWSFQSDFTPEQYIEGRLAKSWEMTDPATLTVNIRPGVYWHNISPVNKREFTADDVAEHYHRMMGTDGYTQPSGTANNLSAIENVNAADKSTLVFKMKQSVTAISQLSSFSSENIIEAPESVKAGNGTITNWQYAVGTGPWILKDYVSNSSLGFDKNPDYWGFDERHPENRLPYANQIKILNIPDQSTRLAALRTGKVDISNDVNNEGVVDWQQAKLLASTDPDLQQAKAPQWGYALEMNVTQKPFSDINVRKALQLAVDLKTIAKSYYGGTTSDTPCGWVSPVLTGYSFTFGDWPQTLKDEYSYNLSKARQILNDAGYPNGFSTNVISASTNDIQLLQVVQSNFNDIGVDLEIKTMDFTAAFAYVMQGKNDGFFYTYGTGVSFPLVIMATAYQSTNPMNFSHCIDPTYDEIAGRFLNATTADGARQALQDADRRIIEQHWSVQLLPPTSYIVYEPYLKGYSGEVMSYGQGAFWARIWTDQSLKK